MTVTRRTFVQATAAGLLLPTWLFRRAEKVRHIDLSLFCDEYYGDSRYSMSTPFFQCGNTYATDGSVCVRTNLIATPPEDSEERRLPPADSLEWDHDAARGWRSLRAATRCKNKDSLACPMCYGKGRCGTGVKPCEQCQGTGYELVADDDHDNFASYERPCRTCDLRTGYVGGQQCPQCRGDGNVDFKIQLASDSFIQPQYHAKLLTLGDVEYAIPACDPPVTAKSQISPIMVRFDGGEGLVMPVIKD